MPTVKRPSLQFYPGDWRANIKLRRCSPASRGVWMDVMCALHDSDEYGVLRWPLKELARAVGASIVHLQELVKNDVLKGSDTDCTPYVWRPRHAGVEGPPVVLVKGGAGPCWYSSRMVRDEAIRLRRGGGTRFGADSEQDTKPTNHGTVGCQPKAPPKGGIGVGSGDGPSSSSSSSPSGTPSSPRKRGQGAHVRFDEFWTAWPRSERKQDKAKCLIHWQRHGLDEHADAILADVRIKRGTRKWQEGFDEAPLVYLRGQRWLDGVEPAVQVQPADWRASRSGIVAMGLKLGLGSWDEAAFQEGRGPAFSVFEAQVAAAHERQVTAGSPP